MNGHTFVSLGLKEWAYIKCDNKFCYRCVVVRNSCCQATRCLPFSRIGWGSLSDSSLNQSKNLIKNDCMQSKTSVRCWKGCAILHILVSIRYRVNTGTDSDTCRKFFYNRPSVDMTNIIFSFKVNIILVNTRPIVTFWIAVGHLNVCFLWQVWY